jgi:hypothetical protein
LGKEKAPIDATKKSKWDNRNDEVCELIKMSISSDLQFHLQGIDDLDEASDKLEAIFGKHNEIQARHLENQLISLNPNEFSCIEYYLSKFKTIDFYLNSIK